jgi:Domain of unknown function (DUF4399)
MSRLLLSLALALVAAQVQAATPPPGVTIRPLPAAADLDTKAPEVTVYIIEPKNGATVSNPVHVVFGLRNMGVAPAGVNHVNTGHHHLLIDTDLPRLDQPIPSSDKVRHFGGGQTETRLILLPGTHTLQLLIGDYAHMPHLPPIASAKVTITVRP